MLHIFCERSDVVKNKHDDIGYLIHQIDNRIKTNIDNHFKVHDLTFSQSQVLHLLEKNGGSMSQKQLQTQMSSIIKESINLSQERPCDILRNKITYFLISPDAVILFFKLCYI